jgi:hypothetical protein
LFAKSKSTTVHNFLKVININDLQNIFSVWAISWKNFKRNFTSIYGHRLNFVLSSSFILLQNQQRSFFVYIFGTPRAQPLFLRKKDSISELRRRFKNICRGIKIWKHLMSGFISTLFIVLSKTFANLILICVFKQIIIEKRDPFHFVHICTIQQVNIKKYIYIYIFVLLWKVVIIHHSSKWWCWRFFIVPIHERLSWKIHGRMIHTFYQWPTLRNSIYSLEITELIHKHVQQSFPTSYYGVSGKFSVL